MLRSENLDHEREHPTNYTTLQPAPLPFSPFEGGQGDVEARALINTLISSSTYSILHSILVFENLRNVTPRCLSAATIYFNRQHKFIAIKFTTKFIIGTSL
jgi:hypothetical protein